MSADSLRRKIVERRRERRAAEAELNRIGMVLDRLADHRERLEQGLERPSGERESGEAEPGQTTGDDDTTESGADAVSALERLVRPEGDDPVEPRREALTYLEEPLLEDEDGKLTKTFFERAQEYKNEVYVPSDAAWWQIVVRLKQFLDGEVDAIRVIRAFERGVDTGGTAESIGHLETVFGYAATAVRNRREAIEGDLQSEFDETGISEPGLIQQYVEAHDEDPAASLSEQPVVMLPVRLETRFQTDEGADDYGDLMVRIFPDQVHVQTHEEELTDEEVTWGKNFWAYLWYACHPEYDLTKYDLGEKFKYDTDVTVPFPFGDRLRGMIDSVDPWEFPEPPPTRGQEMVESWVDRGEVVLKESDEWADDRYEAIKERAWRQVVERFGRERAAYVVDTLAPDPDGRELLEGVLAGHGRWDLSFPSVPRRPEAWTARPTAELLPDQWVVHGTWQGPSLNTAGPPTTVHHVTVRSNAVREPLAVGPDPESVAESAGPDEEANVPPELTWLTDFEEAVEAGMGVRITQEDLEGRVPAHGRFESLVVYGVKTSLNAEESVDALQDALEAHRYTQGLEFLEPGTPTNNTDVESGYASRDDPAESMAVEIGEPLIEDGDYSDGDVLARALGIDPDDGEPHPFAHVENADMTTHREARHVNNALWPGTMGYYLEQLLAGHRWWHRDGLWEHDDEVAAEQDVADHERRAELREGLAWLDAYRRHFVKYVRGDGPFPALRVGKQPYGVLPATPQSTQRDADESVPSFDPKRIAGVTFEEDDGGDNIQVGRSLASSAVMPEESPPPTYNVAGEVFEGDDEDSSTSSRQDQENDAEPGAEEGPDAAAGPEPGGDTTGPSSDRSVANGGETQADGSGGFVPRTLDRVDGDLPVHLRKWIDKFTDVWRNAVDPETLRTGGDGESEDEPPAVPRVGDVGTIGDDTLLDILEMESMAGDYLRRAMFGRADDLASIVVENNPDISIEQLRQLLKEADPELHGEESDQYVDEDRLDAFLSDEIPPSVSKEQLEWGIEIALEAVRDEQFEAVRETLKRYDMTDLDPSIVRLLYHSVFPDEWSYRTVEDLVDDGIDGAVWPLTLLDYDQLVTMGTGFDPDRFGIEPGDPPDVFDDSDDGDYDAVADVLGADAEETQAIHDKMDLIDRYRTEEYEPIVQKSLLRVLLRFGTLQEFVTGRIKLGALYGTLPKAGPGPVPAEERLESWRSDLADQLPGELAAFPGVSDDPGDTDPLTRYTDALEVFRRPDVSGSPLPSFGDFTYSVLQLSTYPRERLKPLVSQTLDLASHRLDAWWTSTGTRRLFELRTAQGNWTDEHRVDELPSQPESLIQARPVDKVRAEQERRTDEETYGDAGGSTQYDPDEETAGDVGTSTQADTDQPTYGDVGTGIQYDPDDEESSGADRVRVPESYRQEGDQWTDADVPTVSIDEQESGTQERDWWRSDHVDPVDEEPAVYVGAYAFGEDLEPDDSETDAEYLHAPSLQQATTAALLRSGHQSHQENDDELADLLAVDLSADRVRLARSLLEGVRNGQSLGELLGYRFERKLHDENLQGWIENFRKVAPAVSGKLKHEHEGVDAGLGEEAAKSDVVDGYRLYRMWKGRDDESLTNALHPSKTVADEETDDFRNEEPFDHLENAVDALRDLLTAESVHQLAQGNIERAGSSVDKLADGQLPPEPEVLETPRSSVGVTHRQLVLFGDVVATSDGDGTETTVGSWPDRMPVPAQAYPSLEHPSRKPSEWSDDSEPPEVPLQVRSAAEPALDAWLEELFPHPAVVSYTAVARWTETESDGPDEEGETTVEHTETLEPTLADHGLSPLDALYLTQLDERPEQSQLERRFAFDIRRTSERPDATIELEFGEAAADDHVSVAEFIELASTVRSLVLDGRPARGDDLGRPANDPDSGYTQEAHNELKDRAPGPDEEPTKRKDDGTVVEGVHAALLRVQYELWNRATVLDPPGEESNMLADVDAAVEAAEALVDDLPMDRIDAVAAELEAAKDASPGGLDEPLLDEMSDIEGLLPAGPTDPEEVEAEHAVEPKSNQELSGTVEPYHGSAFATGTAKTPTESGTLTVDDVGFEADVIVLTVSSAVPRLDATTTGLPIGRSHGVATPDDAGIDQRAMWYGPRSQAPESSADGDIFDSGSGPDSYTTAAGSVETGTALHVGPTGEHDTVVSGIVTAITEEGFEVDIEVDAGGVGPPEYVLEYTAMRLPTRSAVEVGHFRTPETTGEQSIELGIDANYAMLSASTLGETPGETVSTKVPVCRSEGTVVGRDGGDQFVTSTVTGPEATESESDGYENVSPGQVVRLLYGHGETGTSVGKTNATVTSLGTSIDLDWEDVYTVKESMPGASTRKLVTYVAVETNIAQEPAVGTRPVHLGPDLESDWTDSGSGSDPESGDDTERIDVEIGFRPRLVRVSATSGYDSDDVVPDDIVEAASWSRGYTVDGAATNVIGHSLIQNGSERRVGYGADDDVGVAGVDDIRDESPTILPIRVHEVTDDGFVLEVPEIEGAYGQLDLAYEAWPDLSTGSSDEDEIPEEIELWAWSRAVTDSFEDSASPVVSPDGEFDATMNFEDVEPGMPFEVIGFSADGGRADGDVVYNARGRVLGSSPEPDDLTEAFEDGSIGSGYGRSAVAGLLDLARERPRLSPFENGPGATLQDALDVVIWDGTGTPPPNVQREIDLHTDIYDPDRKGALSMRVDPSSYEDALKSLGGVDLSDRWSRLETALAPLDYVGLVDLLTVSRPSAGERGVYRGPDRPAGEVRERLVSVGRDPSVLSEDVTQQFPEELLATLLRYDPRITSYIDGLADPDAEPSATLADELGGDPSGATPKVDPVAVTRYLRMLAEHPTWFPSYLDEHVAFEAESEELFRNLAALLYHPEELSAERLAAVGSQLVDLAAAAPELDRLDDLFVRLDGDEDVLDHREEFRENLGRFASNVTEIGPLDGGDSIPGFDEEVGSLGEDLGVTLETLGDVATADEPSQSFREGVLESVRIPLLKASYFGVYGCVPASAVGAAPADEETLAAQARSVADRIDERLDAARAAKEAAEAAATATDYGRAVEHRVDQIEAVFGETFTVLPPFEPPNRATIADSFEADLVGEDLESGDPLAAETWLQQVAQVRERPATFRRALTYAEALEGTLLRDLRVAQLPVGEKWVGLDGETPEPGQVSIVAQAAAGFDASTIRDGAGDATGSGTGDATGSSQSLVAGLFVDEWLQRVPAEEETTGIALNYDDPGNRAPQSILLAVPPESGWSERDLRTTVSETLGLAKLRMVDLEALAHVDESEGFDLLLPALWFPRVFEHPPDDPSVNFETLERRFDTGPSVEEWQSKKEAERMVRIAEQLHEFKDDDGGDGG